MEHCAPLIENYFAGSHDVLHIGGIPVSALAEKYGTPLFVYDAGIIDEKWNRLRDALPPQFSICYSVKANPNRMILRHFLAKGMGLEIASAGEFCQAVSAGCPADRILFAGPGKSEAELQLVLEKGIGEVHVESLVEAERIARIASRLRTKARVAVRVNPGGEAEGGAMRMGGRPAPFGVDEERLDEALDFIAAQAPLEFRGVHLFTGTQILDFNLLVTQYRKGLEIGLRAARRMEAPLHTLDFGGGLGIPYFSSEKDLDTKSLKEGLAKLFSEFSGDPLLASTKFLVEPGRYLVGEAGVYVTRVNEVKISRGKRFLIVDGGMHHHLAASGNLGQTIKRNYPVAVLNRLHQKAAGAVDVVGPLCTPLDVLARNVELPAAETGDLVGVFQSGAYARAASPLGFLSHGTPPEVWVEKGQHHLIRRRGTYADYLSDQPSDVISS